MHARKSRRESWIWQRTSSTWLAHDISSARRDAQPRLRCAPRMLERIAINQPRNLHRTCLCPWAGLARDGGDFCSRVIDCCVQCRSHIIRGRPSLRSRHVPRRWLVGATGTRTRVASGMAACIAARMAARVVGASGPAAHQRLQPARARLGRELQVPPRLLFLLRAQLCRCCRRLSDGWG